MSRSSRPNVGFYYRSVKLMESFARAIVTRRTRESLLQVKRDYLLEKKLLPRHVAELDRMVAMKLREIAGRE